MTHTTTLHYTDSLVRSAVAHFWKKSLGWGFWVAIGLCVVGLTLSLVSGTRSWPVWTAAAALSVAIAFAVLLYTSHLRSSLAKFRALAAPVATFRADEANFTVATDLGTSTLVWSAVHDLWQFEKLWLLMLSRAQFITLPLADIPIEMRSYIQERISASRSPHVA